MKSGQSIVSRLTLQRLWRQARLPDHLVMAIPALPLLSAFIAGSLPVSLVSLGEISVTGALAIGGVAAVLCLLALRPLRPPVAIALGLGILIGLLHHWAPWQSYRQLLPHESAYVEVEAIVVNDHLPWTEEMIWLEDGLKVELAVRRLRLSRFEPWQPCRGTILMRSRPELLDELDQSLRYGQRLHVRGALQPAWQAALPGGFDYRRFLRTNGIRHVLSVEELAIQRHEAEGFRRGLAALYRLREWVIAGLVADTRNPASRAVLAAMTFGFRGGLDPDDRDLYVRSGMIHLFAISGLHVAVLYLILNGLLMIVRTPFRGRHLIAPVLLLVYVLATGAAPSAMRAWCMLTLWSVGRATLKPTVITNTVVATALVLLVINPLHLFQAGFQFSFVVVLSLIWGWRQGSMLRAYCFEKLRWLPSRSQARWQGWHSLQWRVLQGFLGMTAAWLGGLGLMAWYNQLFLPFSIVINMVVMLLITPIMTLAVLRLATWLVVPLVLPQAVSWFLGMLLLALQGIAFFAATWGGATAVPKPPLALVAIYYLLLTLFFLGGRRLRPMWWLGLPLGICILLLVWLPRLPKSTPAVTLMLPAGEHVPVLIVRYPYRRDPVLVNAGSTSFAYALGDWLKGQGAARVDTLLLLGARRDAVGGMEQLNLQAPPMSVHLVADNRRGAKSTQSHAWTAGARWQLHYRQPKVELPGLTAEALPESDGTSFRLTFHSPAGWQAVTLLRMLPERGCEIDYQESLRGATRLRKVSLPYMNRHVMLDLRAPTD